MPDSWPRAEDLHRLEDQGRRFDAVDVLVTSDSKLGSSLLREALTRLDHRVQDTATAGAGTLLANSSWRADAMVVAMVAGRSSRQRYGAVGVEIGVALGRGIPILLVAKESLPLSFLAGIPRVDYADDIDLLSTQLGLLLEAVAENSPTRGLSRSSTPSLGAYSSASEPRQRAQEFEHLLGQVLQASGAEVVEQVELSRGGVRPDFTVLLPDSANNLGVVLVEAKSIAQAATNSKSAARQLLLDAARRLSSQVLASSSGLGLLVYEGPRVSVPSTPMTVTLPIDELTERLSTQSLAQVLRHARNEAIHSL